MTPDELRAIMEYLMEKVYLKGEVADGEVIVGFDAPTIDETARAGLNAEGFRQILEAPWWDEMVTDVVETPDMCEPDDSPEQVLQYARDVVSEYIRKRAKL
ncbi:MAG: hypothetical protein ACYTG0_29980 [Planctomycetota bacterium]